MSVPKNLISLAEFLEMKKSFDSSIKEKLGTQETQSVWFDFENLKEYFTYVEKEATTQNIKVSGIRFHMIAKTKDEKQLTLALTPTYSDANDKHIDFDPAYSSKEKPATLKSLKTDVQKATVPGSILNQGVNCPQNC